jgi:D-sedoheptulose 7-phosphate isomerase
MKYLVRKLYLNIKYFYLVVFFGEETYIIKMNYINISRFKRKNEIKLLITKLKLIEKKDKNRIFEKLVKQGINTLQSNGKIVFFGNGGSASDAQHLATEITVRYKKNRRAMAALSLATDTSAITAIGNDFSFKKIFSRQIEAICDKNDLAIAITTSGNSKNIIEAIKQCKRQKVTVFALCGNNGGEIKKYLKNIILFPKASTSLTQVMQIFIGQLFCEILEEQLT